MSKEEILSLLQAKKIDKYEAFRMLKKMEHTDLVLYDVAMVEEMLSGRACNQLSEHAFCLTTGNCERFQLVEKRFAKNMKLDHENEEAYEKIANELTSMQGEEIILYWFWEQFEVESYAELAGKKVLYTVFHLIQAILKKKIQKSLKILLIVPVQGAIGNPALDAMEGFAKSLHLEQPNILLKVIETDFTSDLENILQVETEDSHNISLVHYVQEKRMIKKLTKNAVTDFSVGGHPWKEDGVYVITGGMGGLGRQVAAGVLRQVKAKIILVGRSELAGKKKKMFYELKKNHQLEYMRADISNKVEVAELFSKIRQKYESIQGIIHTAGCTCDSFVLAKTDEEINNVLKAKMDALVYCDEETKKDELDFFVTFSSTASIYGNVGQCDYSYANSFMDSYMRRRCEKRNQLSISINWPYLQDGGLQIREDQIKAMKETMGMVPLSSNYMIRVLEYAISNGKQQVLPLVGGKETIDLFLVHNYNEELEIIESTSLLDIESQEGKETKESKAVCDWIVNYIKTLLFEETGLKIDRISNDIEFEKYGIDSILSSSVIQKMDLVFTKIPKTLFYEYLTVDEMASYFVQNHKSEIYREMKKSGLTDDGEKTVSLTVNHKIEKTKEETPVIRQERVQQVESDDIAIIGVNGRFPKADSLGEFWNILREGKDCVTEIPETRWNVEKYYNADRRHKGSYYCKKGGFLSGIDLFDPMFFHITPKEAVFMDPQERLFLESVWHTFEDAGYTRERLKDKVVGMYAGVMYGQYQMYGTEREVGQGKMIPGNSYASIANRVSYFMNLTGPSITLDTMCSSSLTALHLACESIKNGESEMAVVGGVNVTIHPNKYILLCQQNFLSTDGKCRAFGAGGDGYVPGEGVGSILIKPLKEAVADGDHIFGIIKSTAINHGGKTNGYTVPNPKRQTSVIAEAIEKAGVTPDRISYIECHGTGTSLGDPVEIVGLKNAFLKWSTKNTACSLGSVKSNIGHLEAAAGMAGLIKVLLMFKYKQIPKSIHTEVLNSKIDFENTPFTVQLETSEWKRKDSFPRVAGVSAFGAGGSNAHVILEEYCEPEVSRSKELGPVVVPISAMSEVSVADYARSLAAYLKSYKGEVRLEDISYTMQTGREFFDFHGAVVASSLDELLEKLDGLSQQELGNGVYLNDILNHRNELLDLSEKERDERVNRAIQSKDMLCLAKLFSEGYDCKFECLEQNKYAKVISLPGYPFARERYWFEGTKEEKQISSLHPFIDENISTLSEQLYKKTFSMKDTIIKDHKIGQDNILPGAAYIEIIRAAATLATKSVVTGLKNVIWLSPFVITEDEKKDLFIRFVVWDEQVQAEIFSKKENKEVLHCTADVLCAEKENDGRNEEEVITRIKEQAVMVKKGLEIQMELDGLGFHYGQSFSVTNALYHAKKEALGYLVTSPERKEAEQEYIVNPWLLDAAFRTIFGIQKEVGNEALLYVPFSIEQITFYQNFTEAVYSYAKVSETYSEINQKFHINVMDETGSELLSIKNFVSRVYKNDSEVEASKKAKSVISEEVETVETSSSELKEKLYKYFINLISDITDVPVNKIRKNTDIEEYGIDSLAVIELNRKLVTIIPELPKTIFFEFRTIDQIVAYFIKNYEQELVDALLDGKTSDKEKPVEKVEKAVEKSGSRFAVSTSNKKEMNCEKEEIAIIGISGRFPQSPDKQVFWENLKNEKDCITEIPKERWDYRKHYTENKQDKGKIYCKWGGFIENVDNFDPMLFKITPRDSEFIDPQERLFLESVYHTMEDAGYTREGLVKEKVGVFVGAMYAHYQLLGFEQTLKGNNMATSSVLSSIANRVSYYFDFHGPSLTLDTACSSSLEAIRLACMNIQSGVCDMAVAGGVNLSIHPYKYQFLCQSGFLSSDGTCRSFGEGGDGYVPGEGVGSVLLKPLKKAITDGDNIYAVIKGIAANHGGKTNGYTVPNPAAQAAVIEETMKEANVSVDSITVIEAHGTGTELGDPIEVEGLKKAFANATKTDYCSLGSVKSNIGHCESAAGMAALLKVVLEMKHKMLVPTLHSENRNQNITLEGSPFYLQHELEGWKKEKNEKRRAGISAFGAGGMNVHVIVEEYEPEYKKVKEEGTIVTLSAATKAKRKEMAKNLQTYLVSIEEVYEEGMEVQAALPDAVKGFEEKAGVLIGEVLDIPPEDVKELNIDELGLDTFSMTQIIDKLGQEFQIFYTAEQMQGMQNVAEIAADLVKQKERKGSYAGFVSYKRCDRIALSDLAFTLDTGRPSLKHKVTFSVDSMNALLEQLEKYIRGIEDKEHIIESTDAEELEDSLYSEKELANLLKEGRLKEVAKAWVTGQVVDWNLLFKGKEHRISLPLYPFEERLCRISTDNEISLVDGSVHCYTPAWVPKEWRSGSSDNQLVDKLIVFGERKRVAMLSNKLVNQKVYCVSIGEQYKKLGEFEFIIRPDFQEDYARLVQDIMGSIKEIIGLVYLWTYEKCDKEEHIYYLQNIMKVFHPYLLTSQGRVLIASSAQDPYGMAMKGYVLSLSRIWRKVLCRFVVGKVEDVYDVIHEELYGKRGKWAKEVSYENGIRYEKKFVPYADSKNGQSLLKKEGVYVITGGMGALGLLFAKYLIKEYDANIILTGRSKLDESKETILKTLASRENQISYISGDCVNHEDVKKIVSNTIDKYGKMNGIFHAAGKNEMKSIMEKSRQEIEETMLSKSAGLIQLDEVTAGLNLDFMLLFSSTSAIIGDFGQCDYSIANSFLDTFVDYRENLRKQGQRSGKTISINWPLWSSGGMHGESSDEEQYLKQAGMSYLEDHDGLQIFEEVMASKINRLVVFSGEQTVIDRMIQIEEPVEETIKHDQAEVEEITEEENNVELQASEAYLIKEIGRIARSVSSMTEDDIGVDDRLSDVGFDSIYFKEMTERIDKELQLEVTPADFYQYQTIKEISKNIAQRNPYKMFMEPSIRNEQKEIATLSKQESVTEANKTLQAETKPEIVIMGAEGIFPGSKDKEAFMENLLDQSELITKIPKERWNYQNFDEPSAKWGGFIDGIDEFDAAFFGVSDEEARRLDPQQRLLIQTTWKAVEDAGINPVTLRGSKVGVFVGAQFYDYQDVIRENQEQHVYSITGNANNFIANRISYQLDLRGPSETMETACSGSLSAINRAFHAIQDGECDAAIVGGVSLMMSPTAIVGAGKMGILSQDGTCRVFEKNSNGFVKGEGVGVLFIGKKKDAIQNGNNVYAEIRGIAVNHGGQANSVTAPNQKAEQEVVKTALCNAGIEPEMLSYIEAHGTGTEIGDIIELEGLKAAYQEWIKQRGQKSYAVGKCGIGSLKPNIGHLEAASGLASVIKVLMSMKQKVLPGLKNFKNKNPYIKLEQSPFHLVLENEKWDSGNRAAGISSFGYGGSNAHCIIADCEIEDCHTRLKQETEAMVFVLSAKTRNSMRQYAKEMKQYFMQYQEENDKLGFQDSIATLQTAREGFPIRLAMVIHNANELIDLLSAFIENQINERIYYKEPENRFKERNEEVYTNQLLKGGNLKTVAMEWVDGFKMNWNLLYEDAYIKKVPLPTYPFEKECYWVVKECDEEANLKTEAYKEILRIMEQEFEVPVNSLDLDTSLAEIGFDSMKAVKLAENLNNQLGISITPAVFYGNATVGGLLKELNVQDAVVFRKEKMISITQKMEGLEPVAIIGISGIMPHAENLDEYWKNLINNRSEVTEIPKDRWDWRSYYGDPLEEDYVTDIKHGAFIDDVDKFDPLFFSISPKEAETMDPQERLTIEQVWKCVEDAGYKISEIAKEPVSFYMGVTNYDYKEMMIRNSDNPIMTSTFLANRISYLFDFRGPSEVVDTACSSSFVALKHAIDSIYYDGCKYSLAGGINLMLNPSMYINESKAGILSKEGICRTFDANADGYVRGEGVGVVLLKRLSDAVKDNDHIYAVIRGCGLNHGAHGTSLTAPNQEAQSEVIRKTCKMASVDPRTITYIEAHGTGTKLGDPIEIEGIKKGFAKLYQDCLITPSKEETCAISAVKGNVGHMESASGMASLFKVIYALKYHMIPAILNFEQLNPHIQLEGTRYQIVTENKVWNNMHDENGNEISNRAGLSSFGLGGVNAHVILEEYKEERKNTEKTDKILMTFSARNKGCLESLCRDYIKYLSKEDNQINLHDMAYVLQCGREEQKERVAFCINSKQELISKLEQFIGEYESTYIRGTVITKKAKEVAGQYEKGQVENMLLEGKLEEVAQLWCQGVPVHFEVLYRNTKPKRISLPTYEFEKNRYWFEEKVSTTAQKKSLVTIDNKSVQVFDDLEKEDAMKELLIKLVEEQMDIEDVGRMLGCLDE